MAFQGVNGGPGRFVCLEGPDGGGKTTQAARLADWLRSVGRDVMTCRDPGGTPLGDRMRQILLDRGSVPFGLQAEMFLFMASRAELVRQVIGPAIDAGRVVVGDRYLLSNVVYQGVVGGLGAEEVWRVGEIATGGLMPDLTLLLDLPVEVATRRIGAARDRMEDRSDEDRERIRQGFLRLAATYPAPIVRIDGTGDPDEVASRIREEVGLVLGIDPRP